MASHRGAVLATVLALIAPGCGLLLSGTESRIPVRSRPAGAEVWVDGALAGVTPLRVSVASDRNHVIEVRPEGREPQVYRVERRIEPTYVILDILVTGGLGLIVDVAAGSWYESSVSRVEPQAPPDGASPPGTRAGPREPPTAPAPSPGEPAAVPAGPPAAPPGYGP